MQIDSSLWGGSASQAFCCSPVWDGRMWEAKKREREREIGGQGVSRVGMTTDLHLHSVAVGNERSRCRST